MMQNSRQWQELRRQGEKEGANTLNLTHIKYDFAVEEDVPWILKIENEEFSLPWNYSMFLSEIHNADSFFLIARLDVHNLGFIVLRRIMDTGELLQLVVEKDKRRMGVASALLEKMVEFARKNEIESVFLEARKSNEAAISFYLKHGFKHVRQRKDYYVDPVEDAVEMVLAIADYSRKAGLRQ